MVYNNFLQRLLISIILIICYISISLINFSTLYYVILLIYFLIFYEVLFNFKKFKIFIIFYLILTFYLLNLIDFSDEIFNLINLIIIIIISFDIFSYIFGNIYGKIKIIKKISPKKTLEGLIGGILFSYLIGFAYYYYYELTLKINVFIFISLIISSAFFGDVIESYFKRINNLKNSSNLLPGHGGFFDRFDSFILSFASFSTIYYFL